MYVHMCACICVGVCVCTVLKCTMQHMKKSKDTFWGSVFLVHMGSGLSSVACTVAAVLVFVTVVKQLMGERYLRLPFCVTETHHRGRRSRRQLTTSHLECRDQHEWLPVHALTHSACDDLDFPIVSSGGMAWGLLVLYPACLSVHSFDCHRRHSLRFFVFFLKTGLLCVALAILGLDL